MIGALICGVLPATKVWDLAACQNVSCYNEVILFIQVSLWNQSTETVWRMYQVDWVTDKCSVATLSHCGSILFELSI